MSQGPAPADRRDLLAADDLTISYAGTSAPAVDHVSIGVSRGERLGIVGESGSGKTSLALALTDMLPKAAEVTSGTVLLHERSFDDRGRDERRKAHGGVVGRVPQDSLSGLNPVIRIGHQMRDAVRAHERPGRDEERRRVVEAMRAVGMPDIDAKLRAYPHELSGGMRQRVLLAMALINAPEVLVADEPTTALDTTVQAQVLKLLDSATAAAGMALILISHNINVVAAVCDRVAVMYAGEVVEEGPVRGIIDAPQHPYTIALISAAKGNDIPQRGSGAASSYTPDTAVDGCRYAPRCPIAFERCVEHPHVTPRRGHLVRCFAADASTRVTSAGAER